MKTILVEELLGLGHFYLRQYLTEEVLTKIKLLISQFDHNIIYVRYVWCEAYFPCSGLGEEILGLGSLP